MKNYLKPKERVERINLDIEAELKRRVKATAKRHGLKLRQVVEDGFEKFLSEFELKESDNERET